jgi:hypothetical protein
MLNEHRTNSLLVLVVWCVCLSVFLCASLCVCFFLVAHLRDPSNVLIIPDLASTCSDVINAGTNHIDYPELRFHYTHRRRCRT